LGDADFRTFGDLADALDDTGPDLAACFTCLNFADTGEDLRVVDEVRVLGVFPFLSAAGCLDELMEAEEELFLDDVGRTAGFCDVFAKREAVFADLGILACFRDCVFPFVTEPGRGIFDLRLDSVFDKR
jgi:hypothetical protein